MKCHNTEAGIQSETSVSAVINSFVKRYSVDCYMYVIMNVEIAKKKLII